MKQDDLIEQMVSEAGSNKRISPGLLLLVSTGIALALTIALSYAFASLIEASTSNFDAIFFVKCAFVLSVMVSALSIVRDFSTPGREIKWGIPLIGLPFLVMVALTIKELAGEHPSGLEHDLSHASLLTCLWQVALLAVPTFVALSVVVRMLAPVNLRQTGLYVGLLSGAIGAFGYAFHCHENYLTVVTAYYTLAIAQMGILGALLGPKLLRWV